MTKVSKTIGSIVLIFLIVAALYVLPMIKRGLPFFKIKGSAVKVGERVGDLALANANGMSFRLSDYQGKVVLLNFFTNW